MMLRIAIALLLGGAFLCPLAVADETPRCATAGEWSLCTVQPFPRQGEPCLVKITREGLPAAGIAVSVTYRPNSEVAITEEIGRTDARGELSWTPRSAGIGMLAAEGCDLTVSIRFRGIPIGGLVVMLLAAMILFGGNSYSFAKTFGRA